MIKDSNFKEIVISNEFETLDRALIVEVIRRNMSFEYSYPTLETEPTQIEKCKSDLLFLNWSLNKFK